MACGKGLSAVLGLVGLLLVCPASGRSARGLEPVASGPCTPQQLHVALTGNPTELRVMWKTTSGSCPDIVTSGPADALAADALSVADPTRVLTHHGRQASYSAGDMCSAPARGYDWGTTHTHSAVLTGLDPGRDHFYQVEGGPVVRFVAPARAGASARTRVLLFGDMGESEHREAKSPGAARTAQLLLREHQEEGAELVLHVGDISYANGREEIWDTFMETIEPLARHIPYMVAVGNHEYDYERQDDAIPSGSGDANRRADPSGEQRPYRPDWSNYGNDSGGECGVQISNRFVMPDVAEHAYWSRGSGNRTAGGSAAAVAAAVAAAAAAEAGEGRNPTLGPRAGDFLAALRQGEPQQQQQQQQPESGSGRAGGPGAAALFAERGEPAGGGAARANAPFWYSFSHGAVHYVMLSTEHDLEPGSRQYRWLERNLRLVDRCTTPWVVVGMHRPMYCVYPHKSNRIVGDHLRAQLESLLNEHQVDLVVSGHVHSYSRTCNVLGERCVPPGEGGMTHIIVGCAGHKLTDIAYDQEEWLEYAAVRFGYGRLTADSGYSLLFELVGDDGRVHDSVKLHNSRAAMRGCAYADAAEAQLAAAAAAAAGAPGCAGWATCATAALQRPSDAFVGVMAQA